MAAQAQQAQTVVVAVTAVAAVAADAAANLFYPPPGGLLILTFLTNKKAGIPIRYACFCIK